MHTMLKKSTLSGFDESYSIASKSQKSGPVHLLRFRWPSKYPFFCSLMVGTCSITFLDALVDEKTVTHTNFILILVSYILVAMPLFYMQLLLGQYTQMGVILLKNLCPLGHGVSIGFMVLLIVHCFKLGLYSADLLTFCLNSFRANLQWLYCPPIVENICWNNRNGCESMQNCINDTIEPSTFYYFLQIYLDVNPVSVPVKRIIDVPCLTRSILVTGSWGMIFSVLNFTHVKYHCLVRRLWAIIFSFICVNALNMFCRDGNAKVIVDMLAVNTSALRDFDAWAKAINAPINLMGLGRGFHFIHGSYIDPSDSWESTATAGALLNLGVVYTCMIFSRSCMNSLKVMARLDSNNFKYLWRRGVRMYFISIPMALSLYGIPQMWNVLYFISCILIITGNQFIYVFTLEKSFCDAYPVMIKYQKYVSCFVCIISTVFGVLLSSKTASYYNNYLSFHLADSLETLNTFLFSVVVCWIYGVQKFCDDVHFMLGKQPTRFWKIAWYFMPVCLGISYVYITYIQRYHTYNLLEKVVLGIYAIPIPVWAIYEIFRYAKHKHLIGVLQCEEQYGPPDPRDRYLRRLFNPRQETKLKRKMDTCIHKCLLNSKTIRRASRTEREFYAEFQKMQESAHSLVLPRAVQMK